MEGCGGKEGRKKRREDRWRETHMYTSLPTSSSLALWVPTTESSGCSFSAPLPPDLLLPPPRSPSSVSPSKEASPHVMGRQLLGAVDQATLRASLSSRGGAEVKESTTAILKGRDGSMTFEPLSMNKR